MTAKYYWKYKEGQDDIEDNKKEKLYYVDGELVNGTGSFLDMIRFFMFVCAMGSSMAHKKIKSIKQYKDFENPRMKKKKSDDMPIKV